MSIPRKNTIVVDFNVLPKRPSAGEVEDFLEKKVKLKIEDTHNIQLHNLRNCVYIEAINNETALHYEKANCNKHTFVCNGKEFRIPVYLESEAVTVRVHDLPPRMQHQTVIEHMEQYGVVISITRERWKHHFAGVYNGVRVLRMALRRPIPSCITIEGEATLVTYPKQPKTCNRCGKAAHPRQKCEKTPRTAIQTNTPPQTAPNDANDLQLDDEMFPPLTIASKPGKEPNVEGGSPLAVTHDRTEKQQTDENNTSNTTSGDGDDCNDDDDGNDSTEANGFMDGVNQKRRISRKSKAYETKKVCLTQGSQNMNDSNRFQALVEINAMNPSNEEVEEYLGRSNSRNKKCHPKS